MKRKKRALATILSSVFLISIAFSALRGQEDCSQMINNAIQEFTQANFTQAIQILNNVKGQPDFHSICTIAEREKVYFYLSYCNYLLYGCGDSRTEEALCDLKLHYPNFDAARPDYQWVAQDWVSCLRNARCSDCAIIAKYYAAGRDFYNQNNYILAAQELINARIIVTTEPPPRNCPEFDQYSQFSEEYLNLCDIRLTDSWSQSFAQKNYNACFEMEKELSNIPVYRDYLQRLSAEITTKKQEFVQTVNAASQNFNSFMNGIMDQENFREIDFSSLQDSWNEINMINPNWLREEQILESFQTATGEAILSYFRAYGEYASRQFDMRKEPRVRVMVDGFKNFIVTNFQEQRAAAESEYQKIIGAPSPIFDSSDIGVKPPDRNWDWRIPTPSCYQREGIAGYIRCGLVINTEGRVENVNIVETNLNKDNYCARELIENLVDYLQGRRFDPAVKVRYKPSRAARTEPISGEAITVNYYILQRFNFQ